MEHQALTPFGPFGPAKNGETINNIRTGKKRVARNVKGPGAWHLEIGRELPKPRMEKEPANFRGREPSGAINGKRYSGRSRMGMPFLGLGKMKPAPDPKKGFSGQNLPAQQCFWRLRRAKRF